MSLKNQKENIRKNQNNNMTEQHELAKPLADRVLIRVEKEVTKTAGGIILPETVEVGILKLES